MKNITSEEATIIVTNTALDKEKTITKKIKIRPFVTSTAKVSVKFGSTISDNNYGSIRIDVMITCPAYVEEIRDVYKQVRDLADELIDGEIKRVNGDNDK